MLCSRSMKMASSSTLLDPRTAHDAVPQRTPIPSTASHHKPRIQWATALCLAASFASHTLASPLFDELPMPTAAPVLAETLLLDTQIPALNDQGRWTMLDPEENELRRRAAAASSVTTTFEITVPVSTSTATGTASSSDDTSSGSSSDATSASSKTSTATATTSTSSLPSPFDGGLSNNFTTTTCPTFIDNMLADAEFQACYPISLLIQVGTTRALYRVRNYADGRPYRAHNPSSTLRSRLSA